jgi:CheY-like chemotaxis protein
MWIVASARVLRFAYTSRSERPNQRRNIGERAPAGGTETILLVEDDQAVRLTASRVLQSYGYRVFSAPGPEEALALAQRTDKIDLVLTDVVMPTMSGVELAGELAKLHPRLPVLFMSGYAQTAVERHGLVDVAGRLLPKPFTAHALALHVRKALDDAQHMPKSGADLGPH